MKPFVIPEDVYTQLGMRKLKGAESEAAWNETFLQAYAAKYPTEAAEFKRRVIW